VKKTNSGYDVYNLLLDNTILATRLKGGKSSYDELDRQYLERGDIEFLVGKYVNISLERSQYGWGFTRIDSFDALNDFKELLSSTCGDAFYTKLEIYAFLKNGKRPIEEDDSIKISSSYGDLRIYPSGICCKYDQSNYRLNLNNIRKIFEEFYAGVPCSPPKGDYHSSTKVLRSHYNISWEHAAIVRMDSTIRYKERYLKFDRIHELKNKVLQRVGDKLPEEQAQYLNRIESSSC
jgi:hypothetical protein